MEGLSIVDVFAIWCLRLRQEPSLATRTSPLITLGSMIEASWLLILRMNCLVRAAVVKFVETVEGRMISSVARGSCERMMVCDHAWQWAVCLLSALYSPSIAAVWQGYRCRSDKSDFEDLRRTSPSAFDAVQLADFRAADSLFRSVQEVYLSQTELSWGWLKQTIRKTFQTLGSPCKKHVDLSTCR